MIGKSLRIGLPGTETALLDMNAAAEYSARMLRVQEEHDCIASLLIVGINSNEGEQETPTAEQMQHVRHILITKAREKAMDKIEDFCTSGQAGHEELWFNTRTGNEICFGIPGKVQAAIGKKTVPQRFDALFALTHGLYENDVWVRDNECYGPGEALEKAIKALARAWRNLLKHSDDALAIDTDFTRPGIEALLDRLQEAFEAASDFDFNWRA